MPDASRKWVHCDSVDCPIGWHHWECVSVTEKPHGDWYCPRCKLESSEDAEVPEQRREERTSTVPKIGKTAAANSKGTLEHGNKNGRTVVDKGHVRVKKGTAIKKTPSKKRPQWVGWAETSSESEGEDKGSVGAARKAGTVSEGRRTKAHASQSKRRPSKP